MFGLVSGSHWKSKPLALATEALPDADQVVPSVVTAAP